MAEEFGVRVESGKLEEAAARIREQAGKLNAAFEGMTEVMNRTNGYWIGEAGDAHRRFFSQQQPRREEILARLSEQGADLLQMAGVYAAAEKENTELADSLPGDVIV